MTNDKGVLYQDIIREEGIRLKAYKDTLGYTTVGIGFNMDDSSSRLFWNSAMIPESFVDVKTKGTELSLESSVRLLTKKVNEAEAVLMKELDRFQDLSYNRQYALINMVYQLGPTKFRTFKNTIKALNNREFDVAANNILQSLWAKQTPARVKRLAETIRNG